MALILMASILAGDIDGPQPMAAQEVRDLSNRDSADLTDLEIGQDFMGGWGLGGGGDWFLVAAGLTLVAVGIGLVLLL